MSSEPHQMLPASVTSGFTARAVIHVATISAAVTARKPAVVTGAETPATGMAVSPVAAPDLTRRTNLSATSRSKRSGCAKQTAPQENQSSIPRISPISMR